MRERRTRRQLWEAGETPATIRAALNTLDARADDFIETEEGARRFAAELRTLTEELDILEGSRFPNDKAYDDA